MYRPSPFLNNRHLRRTQDGDRKAVGRNVTWFAAIPIKVVGVSYYDCCHDEEGQSSASSTVFFEHLRSIHIKACLWFSWPGEVQSVLLACMRRQKLNITSQQKYWSPCASYRVPRNQPSKEKSEAKNGFNFGYTFWHQFKYRQEGREAKTEAKNGFEKASPIPAAKRHGT